MKFTDMLKTEQVLNEVPIVEAEKTPEDILRKGGFKIKLVTGTSFGTQIDFSKKYTDEEIEEILKDFNIKIKNKSVFIVD